jgi:hypothetical protein
MTTKKQFPIQRSAALCALEYYCKMKHGRLIGFLWFIVDVIDYLLHGFVIARPTCFMMMKLIRLGDARKPAWYVRIAVGELEELLDCVPCFLPTMCFCRRDDGRLRTYDFARIIKSIRAKERLSNVSKTM